MKTPILHISFVLFSIVGLILLSSFIDRNNSYNNNSSGKLDFVHFGQKSGSTQNLNFFEKEEKENKYQLTYGWKDYKNNSYFITFSISKGQLSDAEGEFGYSSDELRRYLEENLEKMREEAGWVEIVALVVDS